MRPWISKMIERNMNTPNPLPTQPVSLWARFDLPGFDRYLEGLLAHFIPDEPTRRYVCGSIVGRVITGLEQLLDKPPTGADPGAGVKPGDP